MAIKIDREQAGDINNPKLEVIAYVIKEHQKTIPRLNMLFDYYEGDPHKIGEQSKNNANNDDKYNANNAKYVTDQMTGFLVGSPISYTAAKDGNIESILTAFNKMRINKHDKELAKDLSVFGIAYEIIYLGFDKRNPNETTIKITKIDPRGIALVTDDAAEPTKLFAVRYIEKFGIDGKRLGYSVEVYTPDRVLVYFTENLDMSEATLKKVTPHHFNDVQVIEYRNNEEKQGDYEQQLSLIDKYNKLQDDRVEDKANFVKAVMITFGFGLPDERPSDLNGNIVLEAPAKSDGGDAQYVTNTFQESEVQVLADSILEDFHKLTYVPNLNDKQFAGNISGEAMKFKLLGLLLAISNKIGYFEDGLIQRLYLMETYLGIKESDVNAEGAKITFKPTLPINRKDIIEQIRDSQEFVPLLISLGWLDDIDDPQEVLDMLNEQKEQEIERNKKLFGEPSPSFDEQANKPKEDEDE